MTQIKPLLIYALHSGNLYGTERMALATVAGLKEDFEAAIMAPPGPALAEAERLGYTAFPFRNAAEFTRRLWQLMRHRRNIAFVATGVMHSLAFHLLNLIFRRAATHLHIVHGGADERLSYGRKRWLNLTGIRFAAVSEFVKARLIAHGVPAERITVIENFLSTERVAVIPRRDRFTSPGIRRAVVISRIDPIKRVDLLLDALALKPELGKIEIRICGSGWQLEELRCRAAASHPNILFLGFTENVPEEVATADLLIHPCPEEPFGLAIIEAMAAGVPVLVPDSGGAGSLVVDRQSGFHFRANDARNLAEKLGELHLAEPELLNRAVAGGDASIRSRFSANQRIADYRRLLSGF